MFGFGHSALLLRDLHGRYKNNAGGSDYASRSANRRRRKDGYDGADYHCDDSVAQSTPVPSLPSRECRFCFAEDETNADEASEWLHPCLCAGSMYWVHSECMDMAVRSSQTLDRGLRCQVCSHPYNYRLVLRPFSDWRSPDLRLSGMDKLELVYDLVVALRTLDLAYRAYTGSFSVYRLALSTLVRVLCFRLCGRHRLYQRCFKAIVEAVAELRVYDAVLDADV